MKYRKNIYCEKEFIKSCIDRLESSEDSYSPNEFLLLNRIKNILFDSYAKLYIDLSVAELEQISNDIYGRKLKAAKKGKQADLSFYEQFMYELYLKQQSGKLQLKTFEKLDFDNQDKIDLNAYYFIEESEEHCKDVMNKYGVLAINVHNITDYIFVLKDNGCAISKKSKNTWKELLDNVSKLPYNAIIIVDNYILNNLEEMTENLRYIFDALRPSNLCIPFQITIFTKLRNDKGQDIPSESRLEKINELLSEYGKNVVLSIVKCQDFHDRIILTNSMFIGCPGGFNLFKQGESQKNTYFSAIYPFFGDCVISWASQAYSNFVTETSSVFKDSKRLGENDIKESFPKFYIGEKKNRILE